MTIKLLDASPLVLLIDMVDAIHLETIDAGAAYTKYLHSQSGDFDEIPLSEFVEVVSESVNPNLPKHSSQIFQYIDLREVDDIYGQILVFKIRRGDEIGSNKHRFHKFDILFAKIMPSLGNKKVALVTQDVTSAIASTEFIVLRKKPQAEINLYYLFRALRSDHFTRQAVANVTGATGRQRINPSRLLELRIIVPPLELQEQIGSAVEQEFTLRTLAAEQSNRANDAATLVLGPTTLRTEES
jgi:restriction endonuclease S subunit